MLIMKLQILLLLIVLSWNISKAEKCDCGTFNEPKPKGKRTSENTRIYKGRNARKKRYPWQIFLKISSKDEDDFCGGTLISTKHILTAAHCFFDVTKLMWESYLVIDHKNILNLIQISIGNIQISKEKLMLVQSIGQ